MFTAAVEVEIPRCYRGLKVSVVTTSTGLPPCPTVHDATMESISFRKEDGEVVLSLRTGIEGWPRLLLIA
jgi:hypothetical protein